MSRFHLSIAVEDLDASGRYYRALFGRAPDIERDDYQQWLLDEPPLNISLNAGRRERGVSHVGIQAESVAEFAGLKNRLQANAVESLSEDGARCCYAHSDKRWLEDPDGVTWELFVTHERAEVPLSQCCASNDDDSESCCA